MIALLEQWWPLLAIFIPAILNALNIKVPIIVPQPKPDGSKPVPPSFPTTFGHGELVAYILAVVSQGLADGTIKLPFNIPTVPVPNAVSLTPEQVMQLLAAKPQENSSAAP